MKRPIRELTALAANTGSADPITIDFDMVEGIAPFRQTLKVGDNHAPSIQKVTAVQLKNGKQFIVKEAYEEIRDWWISVNQ